MFSVFFGFLLFFGSQPAGQTKSTVSLQEKCGFQLRGEASSQPGQSWQKSFGARFVDSRKLALFQVRRAQGTPELSNRTRSTEHPEYELQICILNSSDGTSAKLSLPTNAEGSALMPTHNGRFLVRLGEKLVLYDSDLQVLKTTLLAIKTIARNEWWDVQVSPEGTQVWMVHHQDFGYGKGSQSETLVVNADNLDTLERFSKPLVPTLWSAGTDFMTARDKRGNDGILKSNGSWTEIDYPRDLSCMNHFSALPQGRVVGYGCGGAWVMAADGRQVYEYRVGSKELVVAAAARNDLLALRVDRKKASWFDSVARSEPSAIVVVNLSEKREILKIPIRMSNPMFLDISPAGQVATVGEGRVDVYTLP